MGIKPIHLVLGLVKTKKNQRGRFKWGVLAGTGIVARFSFEVRTLTDKRWMVDGVFESETLALKRARELVNTNKYEGVQAVQEHRKPDGTFGEKIIFNQAGSGPKDVAISIVPIDAAPLCARLEDVYGIQARLTYWRILRKYFEQAVLTPSEILYNYGALARLMDNDPPVYFSALDRIATLQATAAGLEIKAHRDKLFQWGEQVGARAREADLEKPLRKHSLKDYAALAAAAEDWGGPERRDHLICCTIARQLYLTRNWLGKLEAVLGAASADLSRRDLEILDGFIADILGSATVIQELLGARPSLCEALLGLVDLMEGKEEEKRARDEPEFLTSLRRLFADGALPEGAQTLLERLRSQIAGRNPLNRSNPEKEQDDFQRLIARLCTLKGLIGGTEMAEALTERCGLQFQEGGALGRRKAVSTMARLIKNPLSRLRYLLSIAETETGVVTQREIIDALEDLRCHTTDIHSLVNRKLTAPVKMKAVSDVQRAVLVAAALPEDLRQDFFEELDDLLVDFIERDSFVSRLDSPDLPLRERATRLVRFCSSGILVEGRALAVARKRVAEHLRQPNFVEHFTADLPSPNEAQEALRQFYVELAGAGFRV